MIQWNFEPGRIIPTFALRSMVRGYQMNYPSSQLCAELLLLDDTAFLTRLDEIFAASEKV